jgi:hypothetical protein
MGWATARQVGRYRVLGSDIIRSSVITPVHADRNPPSLGASTTQISRNWVRIRNTGRAGYPGPRSPIHRVTGSGRVPAGLSDELFQRRL